jgi:hypothetical protein
VAPLQRVTGATSAPEKGAGEILQAGDEAAKRFVEVLAEAKVI